jgi:hypothetical protein
LNRVLGVNYAATWANTVVIHQLQDRTVDEALADGVACKVVWRAVWEILELPATEL